MLKHQGFRVTAIKLPEKQKKQHTQPIVEREAKQTSWLILVNNLTEKSSVYDQSAKGKLDDLKLNQEKERYSRESIWHLI